MTEQTARVRRLRRARRSNGPTGGWTSSGSSAASVSTERTCCSSVMASSFEVEQPSLAQLREPACCAALHRAHRDPEQSRGLGLALIVEEAKYEHRALGYRKRREG